MNFIHTSMTAVAAIIAVTALAFPYGDAGSVDPTGVFTPIQYAYAQQPTATVTGPHEITLEYSGQAPEISKDDITGLKIEYETSVNVNGKCTFKRVLDVDNKRQIIKVDNPQPATITLTLDGPELRTNATATFKIDGKIIRAGDRQAPYFTAILWLGGSDAIFSGDEVELRMYASEDIKPFEITFNGEEINIHQRASCIYQAFMTITDEHPLGPLTFHVAEIEDMAGNKSGPFTELTEGNTPTIIKIDENNPKVLSAKLTAVDTIVVKFNEAIVFGEDSFRYVWSNHILAEGSGTDTVTLTIREGVTYVNENDILYLRNIYDLENKPLIDKEVKLEDKVAPITYGFALTSSNIDTETADIGDTITMIFRQSEEIQIPTITINGRQAEIENIVNPIECVPLPFPCPAVPPKDHWRATTTLLDTDPPGPTQYSITMTDKLGNTAKYTPENIPENDLFIYPDLQQSVLQNTGMAQINSLDHIEESDDAVFTIRVDPAPAVPINLQVEITQIGDYIDMAQLGTKQITVDESGTTYIIPTISAMNNTDNQAGSITMTVIGGQGIINSTEQTIQIYPEGTAPEDPCPEGQQVQNKECVDKLVTLNIHAWNEGNTNGIKDPTETAAQGLLILTYVPSTGISDILFTGTDGTISEKMPVETFWVIALAEKDTRITTSEFNIGDTTYYGVKKVENPNPGDMVDMDVGLYNDPCPLIPKDSIGYVLLGCDKDVSTMSMVEEHFPALLDRLPEDFAIDK